jgi:hypothetical protein
VPQLRSRGLIEGVMWSWQSVPSLLPLNGLSSRQHLRRAITARANSRSCNAKPAIVANLTCWWGWRGNIVDNASAQVTAIWNETKIPSRSKISIDAVPMLCERAAGDESGASGPPERYRRIRPGYKRADGTGPPSVSSGKALPKHILQAGIYPFHSVQSGVSTLVRKLPDRWPDPSRYPSPCQPTAEPSDGSGRRCRSRRPPARGNPCCR